MKGTSRVGAKTSSDAKESAKADAPKSAEAKDKTTSKAAKKGSESTKDSGAKPSILSGHGAIAAAAPTASTAPSPTAVLQTPPLEPDPDEVILTDAEGRRYCRSTDCDQIGQVDGYCRYHYLYFWKKIQVRKKILADGKLDRYIEELTSRYTDKFVELLRKDLRTEKDFLAAVAELELDDSASSAQDDDEAKNYIEEISGAQSESSGRDDEGY